ncbi:acetyl-CoA C-acetyltransferase [Pseudomonas sp. S31]|nr:acetyl-CoA C-acetyltransferase [Pseudomonas sp. S31]
MGHGQVLDTLIKDGLWDAFNAYHMGITAENLAEQYGIGRTAQDAYALRSQQRTVTASESGRFKDEIAPAQVPRRDAEPLLFAQDEQPRAATDLEGWASCVQPSRAMARSLLAMLQPSMTAPLRCFW